jgi:hypothetical protein
MFYICSRRDARGYPHWSLLSLGCRTFTAPPNTPMEIRNTGDKPTKVINVLILEKGKPRSTPVQR